MNNMKIRTDGGYAEGFELADDLYLFFQFKSEKSACEIGIAFDQFIDGGDWYVNNGHFDNGDYCVVDEIVYIKMPKAYEWKRFEDAITRATMEFNGVVEDCNGHAIDFEAAINLMDDEIREGLHADGIESKQKFIEAYAERHAEKYGDEFAPYHGLAW